MSIHSKFWIRIRPLIQLLFLAVVFAGFFLKIRPYLLILMPITLLAGSFFCGWFCPFGALQDFAAKAGSLIFKKKLKMPWGIQKYLQYSRYLFTLLTVLLLSKEILESFPTNSYLTAYRLLSLKSVSSLALGFFCSFLLIALIFERPFCNYFCSEGIRYGLLSLSRIFTIRRNPDLCVSCKKCDQACPMNIPVSSRKDLRNFQCVNCFQCVTRCPVPGALKYGRIPWREFPEKIKAFFQKKS